MAQKIILYVEDEETDVFLMRIAFKKARIEVPLKTVSDGEGAIAYLRGAGAFADREAHPVPGLVLLDLNIPRLEGLKVLEWIRQQPELASLPVVIYTSSEQPQDLADAQRLGADDYLVKPASIEKIADIATNLIQRWLG